MKLNLHRIVLLIVAIEYLFIFFNVIFRGNNLFAISISLFVGGGLIYATTLLKKLENVIDKYFNIMLLTCSLVFIVIQVFLIDEFRFEPMYDLGSVYNGAIEWVNTGTFASYYDYYSWFPINLGAMSVLYLIFLMFAPFTTDFFWAIAFVNLIAITVAVALVGIVVSKVYNRFYGFIAYILLISFPPLWILEDAFYTDALSFVFPILIYYIYIKIKENNKKVHYFSLAVAVFLGSTIKMTSLIVFMAIVIYELLSRNIRFAIILTVCVACICFPANRLMNSYFYNNHLDAELAEIRNTPNIHLVMMGLKGDGAYDPEEFEFTRSFDNPKVRDRAIVSVIKARISEYGLSGMLDLYGRKAVVDFGNGTINVSDFLDDNPINDSPYHEYILKGGSKYSSYLLACNIMFFTIFAFAIIEGVYLLVGNAATGMTFVPVVALGGLMFLLLNWETNSRYITNFIPIIFVLATGGLFRIVEDKNPILPEWKLKNKILTIINTGEFRIFAFAVAFRAFVYFISVIVAAIFGDYSSPLTFDDFLNIWVRWDSPHYLNIAENGYAGAIENGEHIFLVFYPLYPWLIKLLSLVFQNYKLCGILISTICFAMGSVFLYRNVYEEFNSEEIAWDSVILIALFPFGFFFGSVATESLFYMLVMLFYFYLKRNDYGMVAFWGMLACMTKVQGALLAFVVLVHIFRVNSGISLLVKHELKEFWKVIIKPGLLAANMLWGLVIYLLINYAVEGDFFRFMYYQKNHWNNGFDFLPHTISYVMNNANQNWFTSIGMSMWVPEGILFGCYIVAIVFLIKKKVNYDYIVYLISFFILTYSSTWLISGGRYTLSAYPIFMALAIAVNQNKKLKTPVYVIFSMLMVIYYVGYYMYKQIM